jgi:hypothetical protein
VSEVERFGIGRTRILASVQDGNVSYSPLEHVSRKDA